jgi:hypothetical protein
LDAWERQFKNGFGLKITQIYGLNGFSRFSEPPFFKSLFTFWSSEPREEESYTFFFMGHLALDRILVIYLYKLAQSFGLIENNFDFSSLNRKAKLVHLPKISVQNFDDLYQEQLTKFFYEHLEKQELPLETIILNLKRAKKLLENHVGQLSDEERSEHGDWHWTYRYGRASRDHTPTDSLNLKCYPPFILADCFLRSLRLFEFDELHKRSGKKCACHLLVELRLPPDDHQATFVKTGEENEGYFFGTGYECSECGARWFDAIGDDDYGRSFWEYWDKDRNGYYEYPPRETQVLELLERVLKELSE